MDVQLTNGSSKVYLIKWPVCVCVCVLCVCVCCVYLYIAYITLGFR